tara:strand:- start:384 stop:668 length:285 start_codon:yes stop_codon:yes gene_type:complete
MRYSTQNSNTDKDTKNRVQEIPDYPEIPLNVNDIYIQANDGTRLDMISMQYYNTPKYWWIIALANKMGKGTLYVKPGAQLRIPVNPSKYIERIR